MKTSAKRRASQRRWRLKNIDKRRQIEQRYRKKNRERIKVASKKYCDKNRKKRRESANRWYHENAAYVAQQKRAQHLADPSKRRAQQLKHNFGMTLETYQATLKAQKHRCSACTVKFTARGKFKACVDHDHSKGTKRRGPPRGIICNRCNWVLGQVADDVKILDAIKSYLKKWS